MKTNQTRRKFIATFLLLSFIYVTSCSLNPKEPDIPVEDKPPSYRDIYSDTWVATDALGRTMPGIDEVGQVKDDQCRVVGIFYVTFHTDYFFNHVPSPYTNDVTKVLQQDPAARLDGNHPLWKEGVGPYHCCEPEDGYFLSKDEYVIRKDMSMLTDAGVDVLILDVTNAVHYWSEWEVLFSVMQQMKAEGNKTPQFCFWAFNGPVITVVQDLYEKIYNLNKWRDLWFYWDGKPLLLYNANPAFNPDGSAAQNPNPNYDADAKTNLLNPHYNDPDYCEEFYKDYTKAVKQSFTLRNMWWGYYEWGGERYVGTENNWSFGYDLCDERVRKINPDNLVSRHMGKKEQSAVTPAQHATTIVGKSWTREHGEPKLNQYDMPEPTYVPWLGKTVNNPTDYGIYFQERWDEALKSDPQFIYINDWNEWIAGKYASELHGGPTSFMGRESNFYFVDQYNAEFNRAIQPMKDGYADNYYMQMAQNIRRYKGVRPIPENKGYNRIVVDGDFDDWSSVTNEYRDTKGDIFHRDYNGYGGAHYVNNSGRNDIITGKVAVDEQSIYFWVETADPLTPHTDPHWMMLFLDADNDTGTGWYGYDYVVNSEVKDDKLTTLMKYSGEEWEKVVDIPYRYEGSQMELAIPRKLLNLNRDEITVDFKWSDNAGELTDPISFCLHGDTAPNRRFNYRFVWGAI